MLSARVPLWTRAVGSLGPARQDSRTHGAVASDAVEKVKERCFTAFYEDLEWLAYVGNRRDELALVQAKVKALLGVV
ncbi:MAG TPA: hypothetical protein ENK31_07630 [Nannocystis exedens]|nr:hypothetical protein [Nannocystis exedens]